MKQLTKVNLYDILFITIIIIYIPLLSYTIFSKYNFLSYVKKEYTKITFDLYVSILIIILLSVIFLLDVFGVIHTDLKNRFRDSYKQAVVALIISLFSRLDFIAPVFIVIFFFLYYMHDGKTDEIKSKKT